MGSAADSAGPRGAGPTLATLVFVGRQSSGASRRMESLVAWVKITQKRRVRVLELDAERHSVLVARLGVTTAPSLVLLKDSHVVGRLEGKSSGREIDELIKPYLQSLQ